jgi:hypothetical protein
MSVPPTPWSRYENAVCVRSRDQGAIGDCANSELAKNCGNDIKEFGFSTRPRHGIQRTMTRE